MIYLGHDIIFRYYGGELRAPGRLPYPDYSGYYIQFKNRIENIREGIFIAHLGKQGPLISPRFQNKDQELKSVWIDLTRVLSELPDANITYGNCKFNVCEWRRYLDENTDDVHKELQKGFDRSPMFQGRIKGLGPRYCPSIEDKINRFAERDRHQI
jgi:hypothetical protein